MPYNRSTCAAWGAVLSKYTSLPAMGTWESRDWHAEQRAAGRGCTALRCFLFTSQCGRRIQPHGTARGNVAGGQEDCSSPQTLSRKRTRLGETKRLHARATYLKPIPRAAVLWTATGGIVSQIKKRLASIQVSRTNERDYKLAPKASRRPSQSFTTNSRQCHGISLSSRVNSTPWAAYSA